jgi:hypothetical protein
LANKTKPLFAAAIVVLLAGSCGAPPRNVTVNTDWTESALDGPTEGLSVRLTKGAQAKPTQEGPAASASLAARTCLAHLLTGLFACEPRCLDAIDRDAAGEAPDCAVPLDRAYAVAAAELDLLTKNDELRAVPPGVREPLELCAGASALFLSMAAPRDRKLALRAASELKRIGRVGLASSGALLGAGAWSRAAFFAQAPPVFGGRLDESEVLFKRAFETSGPLEAWVHALKARTLCAARQDRSCARDAMEASRKANAVAEVRRVADRWLLWIEQRDGLLFGPAEAKAPPPAAAPPISTEPDGAAAEATGS